MPHLTLSLFGGFKATLDAMPLTRFRSDKARALLAFLAVEQDRPHRRETLTGLLWSEQSETEARHNLRQTFLRLRQALGDEDAAFLRATPETLEFNRASNYSLDVADFARALDSRQAHNAEQSTISRLQSAVELYRGDFLAGFTLADAAPFEEWLLLTRERLREQMLRALETLTEHFERAHDYGAQSQCAQRTLEIEPWRETAHRALMRALALRGEPNAALAAYERCREILGSELSLEPDEETRALADQIRSGNLDALVLSVAPRHNLPAHLTPFIGRAMQVDEIQKLVQESKYRLVTLIGVGGMGKTRLSQQVAEKLVEHFADGVWLVELAAQLDAALVPKVVASALGVPEAGSLPLAEKLRVFVRDKTLLLVLDNCEHLLDACARLAAQLLRAAPNLYVLATSREPLGLTGEHLYRVPSLKLPLADDKLALDALREYESVHLFIERAGAVEPQFELTNHNAFAVAQICRRLDGIPLAIELAAARLNLLSPQEIASRLDYRFEFLTTGSHTALPQHQTLRALIDWSFGLLDADERVLFRGLSVFVGGCTLDAVVQVCETDADDATDSNHSFATLTLLTNLVNKSLVVAERRDDETRYTMLETIREYARGQLRAAGAHARLQERHYEYFYRRAREIAPHLEGREQSQWLDRLERDHANLRAALAWSIEVEPAKTLQLAGALVGYLEWRDYLTEGLRMVEQALARSHPEQRAARLEGIKTATQLARRLGHFPRAVVLAHTGLNLAAELQDISARAYFLNALGVIYLVQWHLDASRAYLQASLSMRRQVGSPVAIAQSLMNVGQVTSRLGEFETATACDEEAIYLAEQRGEDGQIGFAWYAYAQLGRLQGAYGAARVRVEKSIAAWARIGYKWGLALAYAERVTIAILDDSENEADECLEQCLELNRRVGGVTLYLIEPLIISHYAHRFENPTQAVHLLSAAEKMRAYYDLQYAAQGRAATERALAHARSQLDAQTFAREWDAGQELAVEEMLEQALE